MIIDLKVKQNEIDYVVESLFECKYKEVYSKIDELRKARASMSIDGHVVVSLNEAQIEKALEIIGEKKFKDVFELAAKISEQLNFNDEVPESKKLKNEEANFDNDLAFSLKDESSVDIMSEAENIEEPIKGNKLNSGSSTLQESLPKDLLERMAERKKRLDRAFL